MWETLQRFLVPGFKSAHLWLLWPFREWSSRWKISLPALALLSPFSFIWLCLLNVNKNKPYIFLIHFREKVSQYQRTYVWREKISENHSSAGSCPRLFVFGAGAGMYESWEFNISLYRWQRLDHLSNPHCIPDYVLVGAESTFPPRHCNEIWESLLVW